MFGQIEIYVLDNSLDFTSHFRLDHIDDLAKLGKLLRELCANDWHLEGVEQEDLFRGVVVEYNKIGGVKHQLLNLGDVVGGRIWGLGADDDDSRVGGGGGVSGGEGVNLASGERPPNLVTPGLF